MTDHPRTLKDGRYLLVDGLGEGGMATVYRAYDQRLGVWRAIKLLLPEMARRESLRQRFETEARTMAVLEHRHVVRIYDVDRDGDSLFIVMELLTGGALVDWLEDHGKMPPRMAIEALLEVCAGVSYAHSRGVVHRDLKPHNVLIDTDGLCKVTDFGIARAADPGRSVTQTGAIMGTHGYMAPEQKVDAKSVDARADVYALGATLFALVANSAPPDLFVSFQDPKMLEPIPPSLRGLVMMATEYMAEDRYQTVDEFAKALREVRDTLPIPEAVAPLARPAVPEPPPPSPESFNVAVGAGGIGVTIAPATTQASSTVPERHAEATLAPEMLDEHTLPEPETVARSRSRMPIVLLGALAFFASMALVFAVGTGLLVRSATNTPSPPPEQATEQVAQAELPEPEPPVEVLPQPVPKPEVAEPEPVVAPSPTPRPAASRPRPKPTPKPTPEPAPQPEPVVVRVTSPQPPAPVPVVVSVPVAAPAVTVPASCIRTTAPNGVAIGAQATFSAAVCDAAGSAATLHFRPVGGAWQSKLMPFVFGTHRVQVPIDSSFSGGLQYYITAGDASDGSRSAPNTVSVR